MIIHFNDSKARDRGLGTNLQYVSCQTFCVESLERSKPFYTDTLKFSILEEDAKSITFDCNNGFKIRLIVGAPVTFAARNLIVSHTAIDLEPGVDVNDVFTYLKQKGVPYEINVSVSTGKGPSFIEGGSFDNTVGQAFLRDKDGYYFEICNCNILNDLVLGGTGEKNYNHEAYKEYMSHIAPSTEKPNKANVQKLVNLFSWRIAYLAETAKARVAKRKADPASCFVQPLPKHEQPENVDPVLLENFLKRDKIYSSITQSFHGKDTKTEDKKAAKFKETMTKILLASGNKAPNAICIMQQMVTAGDVQRVYRPPAYYEGEIDDGNLFNPEELVVAERETGYHETAPKFTAGQECLDHKNTDHTTKTIKPLKLESVNHIGLIVKNAGKSAEFCSDVLGFQDVVRPPFDRHGAWFTGGNVEIHLILGNPLTPDRTIKGADSVSVSLKVNDLSSARTVLEEKQKEKKFDYIQLEVEDDACYVRSHDGYVFKIHE